MNNGEDKSTNIMILLIIAVLLMGIGLFFAKDFIANLQGYLIKLDFIIIKNITPLQAVFGGESIMQYYDYVFSNRFDFLGFDANSQKYYNISNGKEVVILEQMYQHFFVLNAIILTLLLLPFTYIIKILYSKQLIKYKIHLRKEEVYPDIVKSIRRKDSNNIFQVMDYMPPFIQDLEDFKNGSLRISMKAKDNLWLDTQKNKLIQIKTEMKKDNPRGFEYDYLKLIYIYRSTGNSKYFRDEDLIDYLKWARYKKLTPVKNRRLKTPELPNSLIHTKEKSNKKKIIDALKLYLQPHYPDKEFGLIIMQKYYIFNPLTEAKLDNFSTSGSKELIKIFKKFILDDFKIEMEGSISNLQAEINKFKKDKSEASYKQIEENENLILDIQRMLDPNEVTSRKKKIIDLTMIHKFEETFLLALLQYGRSLVNLPVGVLSRMKFENSVLWYALTSMGRTYKYNAGLPLTILYNIEILKSGKKDDEKIDPAMIELSSIISEDVANNINKVLGDQLAGKMPHKNQNK